MYPQEIIEVPVMAYDTDTDQIVATFHKYCTPWTPITPFCTELTGITQDMVDAGEPFDKVLKDLVMWVRDLLVTAQRKEFLFVTCGNWDFAAALPKHCGYLGIPVPGAMRSWCNIKTIFSDVMRQKPKGMMGMLRDLNIKHVGRHHSGIDDVRNITEMARKLNRSPRCGWRVTGGVKVQ